MPKTLTRAALFDLIWSKPMREAAADLGYSDVGLRKLCLKLGMPLPSKGHWLKPMQSRGNKPNWSEKPDAIALYIQIKQPEPKRTFPEEEQARLDELLDREAEPEFAINVDPKPIALHPLTKSVAKVLASGTMLHGRVSTAGKPLPLVAVSPEGIGRALVLVDALVRAAAKRGFTWRQSPSKAGNEETSVCLMIEDVALTVAIHETTRRVARKPATRQYKSLDALPTWDHFVPYEFLSTNEFSIREGSHKIWLRDTPSSRLETRIGELFLKLIEHAFDVREARRQREIAQRRAVIRDNRRRQIQAIQRRDHDARKSLVHAFEKWRAAQDLRAFILAADAAGIAGTDDDRRRKWHAWAMAVADQLDPLAGCLPTDLDPDFAALDQLSVLLEQDAIDNEPLNTW